MLSSLIAGILLSDFFNLPSLSSVPFLGASLLAYLWAAVRRKRYAMASASKYNIACASMLLTGVGIFTSSIYRPELHGFSDGTYAFTGRVIDYTPTGTGDRTLMEIKSMTPVKPSAASHSVTCRNVKAMVTVSDVSKISYGDLISGCADFTSIDTKGNVRNDDYVAYQKSKGILLKGYTVDDSEINILARGGGVIPFFRNMRQSVEILIEKTNLSVSAKAFLISVGLGDRSYMPEDDRQVFIDGGVAHIFAVSGMHVGMAAAFILLVLSLFFFDGRRRWKFIIALPLVWFYILLTGASPATLRAGLMLSIGLSALFLQRRNSPMMALGWTVLIILAFMPGALFDVGFQLSVVCVGSLILLVRPLNFVDHRGHPRLHLCISIVLVTLVATFSSWALCAFYFHRLSLMFLPANILAVPLLPFYLGFSMLYVVLCALGLNIVIFADALSWIYQAFIKYVDFFNSISLPVENIHIGWPVVILWLSGIVALGITLSNGRLKRLWIPVSLFATALLVLPLSSGNIIPDGFIIQKRSDAMAIMTYDKGRDNLLTFPSNAISSVEINGQKILIIDRNPADCIDSLSLESADFILLASGIGKNLPDTHDAILPRLKPTCRVVIHPSVHWRYEKKLTSHPRLHSLRYDGPLHAFPAP